MAGIQTEIRQRKPFDSLEQEVFLSLQRTAGVLQWRATEMLKRFGLSPTQYNALRILRGAGQAGLPCSQIGERMVNRDPDITRLLDRLERRGFVKRSRGKDRRVIMARISAKGLELLQEMDAPVHQMPRSLLGHIGQDRLKLLNELLQAARSQPE